MTWTCYKLQYAPTGKFIAEQDPTYALHSDTHYDKYLECDYDPAKLAHWRKQWEEAHWFVEDSKAKLFKSLTHIRRAFGSAREKAEKYDDYRVLCSDGTSCTLTEVFVPR